ncbi:MAG: hypothetical protein ABIG71_02415 [Candidatus Uhrbacteria bacterium]
MTRFRIVLIEDEINQHSIGLDPEWNDPGAAVIASRTVLFEGGEIGLAAFDVATALAEQVDDLASATVCFEVWDESSKAWVRMHEDSVENYEVRMYNDDLGLCPHGISDDGECYECADFPDRDEYDLWS